MRGRALRASYQLAGKLDEVGGQRHCRGNELVLDGIRQTGLRGHKGLPLGGQALPGGQPCLQFLQMLLRSRVESQTDLDALGFSVPDALRF